jgi:hypothetical protein
LAERLSGLLPRREHSDRRPEPAPIGVAEVVSSKTWNYEVIVTIVTYR